MLFLEQTFFTFSLLLLYSSGVLVTLYKNKVPSAFVYIHIDKDKNMGCHNIGRNKTYQMTTQKFPLSLSQAFQSEAPRVFSSTTHLLLQ